MPATMLLADDSSTIRRVIELTLANEDMRLVSVVDGESAILQIEAEPPDIVLADVGMQKLDGYGVASHLKQSPALRNIPVLLLTGAFEPIDEAKARASGCDGILVKPFDPQLMLTRVKELLAGRPRSVASPEEGLGAKAPNLAPVPPQPPQEPAMRPDAQFPSPLDLDAPVEHALNPPFIGVQMGDDGGLELEFDQIEAAFEQRHRHETPVPPGGEIFIMESLAAAPGLHGSEPRALDALGLRGFPSAPEPTQGQAPETSQPAVSDAAAAVPGQPPAAPARPPRLLSRVSLADAFSALLAAEQAPPAPSSTADAPAISEAMVEELVRRVLTRMTEDAVHRFVAETAERVLREELNRLKKGPH